jgi:hypothetical protein
MIVLTLAADHPGRDEPPQSIAANEAPIGRGFAKKPMNG